MPPMTVVRSPTHLEIELLRLPVVEVQFASPDEEEKFEKRDVALAMQIEAEISKSFPNVATAELLITNYDWWPNKSRSVVLSQRAFCTPVVERLAALLQGEYEDWKIHVYVCKSLGDHFDDSEVGSLCILPGRIIIEQGLHALLAAAA
jgi:hypothetical protein